MGKTRSPRAAALRSIIALALFMNAAAATSSDAYVVRFLANGKATECSRALWADDILFYNRLSTAATVELVEMSNGGIPAGLATHLVLPPRKVISAEGARRFLQPVTGWRSADGSPLWVVHLAVPEGVTMESRDEVYVQSLCGSVPEISDITSAGKVSLPIFHSLVPAGIPQVKLGTDQGERSTRLNVAIFNDANETASASIEVRKACDDTLLDSRTVEIAAKSISQFGGFHGGSGGCLSLTTPAWMSYAVITVDQPSFSYTSNVTESLPASVVPPIGLAVSNNTEY